MTYELLTEDTDTPGRQVYSQCTCWSSGNLGLVKVIISRSICFLLADIRSSY